MTDDFSFRTHRLFVGEWHRLSAELAERPGLAGVVANLLSASVTQSLPPEWQGDYDTERAEAWIQARDREGMTLLVTLQESGLPAGLIILHEESASTLRLGYLLSESIWGQGIASELVGGLVEQCRVNGIQTIVAGVALDNAASRRVLEKNGFVADEQQPEKYERFYRLQLEA